jgi:hypothetical protein
MNYVRKVANALCDIEHAKRSRHSWCSQTFSLFWVNDREFRRGLFWPADRGLYHK